MRATLESEEDGHGTDGGAHDRSPPRRPQHHARALALVLVVRIPTALTLAVLARLSVAAGLVLTRPLRLLVGEVAGAEGAAAGLDVVLALGQLDGVAGVGGGALLEGLLADEGEEGRVVVLEARLGAVGAGAAVLEGVLSVLVPSHFPSRDSVVSRESTRQ